MRSRLGANSRNPLPVATLLACCALAWLQASSSSRPAAQDAGQGPATWDADVYGNHRAVVRVAAPAPAVWAHIPWRRRDTQPARKEIVVVDAHTGERVGNVARVDVGREAGDLVFEPRTVPGEYHVYYLPNVSAGSPNYPTVVYPRPQPAARDEWLAAHGLTADGLRTEAWKQLPRAELVALQSIDAFNGFDPMEIIATRAEVEGLLAAAPQAAYLVFPEDRRFAIRMTDDLPQRWVAGGPGAPFTGDALRGEFFAFQLGVYAARAPLADVRVEFGDLRPDAGGAPLPAMAFRCINQSGVDWMGRPFSRAVSVERGKVQAFWCGVQVGASTAPGTYRGTLRVAPRGLPATPVDFILRVAEAVAPASGDDEPWRLSRLRWLDSTLAHDDEVIAPYEPVRVSGRVASILGRRVTMGDDGLPQRIESFFTPEMTGVGESGRDLLAAPVALTAETLDGQRVAWQGEPAALVQEAPARVAWQARRVAPPLALDVRAELEADGNIEVTAALHASARTALGDVRLEVPVAAEVARYAMGLGLKGGARPARFSWAWDVRKNQDAFWLGDVNAGVQVSLKDEGYVRPLNTNFYLQKPLALPASWHNGGRGGCRLEERGQAALFTCYGGPRVMEAGETLRFDFRLLLTPFRPIDPRAQWASRYYHRYAPVDEVRQTGANTINVHHANAINPWINYPFLRPAQMKAYVDEAHAKGLKVKIYYTVRELSNRAPELFALRSLGDEVLAHGPGGGFSWLQEHLGSDYIAAWFVPELKDAAVINSGVSRWHNYYVEGLAWLVRNVGIDGLYIDDVAFDRVTMKRVRRVLDRGRPGALIDLHSANQYNVRDGFASSANLYLEHFPYLDRLWFGEYFDYDAPPDYWLVEMSGIPFGLMGEMLEGGGNPWRGMVFGMTARLPWAGDPRPLWKVWDAFGLGESRMIGWWAPSRPVKTGRSDVVATTFVRPGRALVALASWSPGAVNVTLDVDWARLGLDPAQVTITAPPVERFQEAASFRPGQAIPVAPGRGWLLVLEER